MILTYYTVAQNEQNACEHLGNDSSAFITTSKEVALVRKNAYPQEGEVYTLIVVAEKAKT